MHIHHDHVGGHHSAHSNEHSLNHTPMDELVALMKYMTGHNAAHAKELADLANKLDEAGNRLPISTGVAELADGQNTVTVTVQVSTGELLTAFTGTLTK